ncbi:glutamate synthase subunit beta [Clostridium sp. SYSU_GA19001]|uniref:glutamate synthase subunit beta n=1 Tax=Clostridium caldaquaticum TaxID=2940653 RepID=UPI002077322D|nr:glutamate synthase subunit beta [Clostridium caldaquaticum]MCM8711812.1 glutamate synthase subunit beta [Clostridium caldaquaticum]
MGKLTGFKDYERENPPKRPIEERTKDYKEIVGQLSEDKLKTQAARCMNCGVPFCNWACPVANLIPDFNDMVYKSEWEKAYKKLSLTSNFPEFTGRICPALCEGSCTLGVNREAVTVKQIELAIIETAFENGWVKPNQPKVLTGKKVAVVGSGPAGLAAADLLNSFGHSVTVFEKDNKPGGILRYGIPDFKLEKQVIDRRVKLMEEAGVVFKVNTYIGKDYSALDLEKEFDAVLLTGGVSVGRDLQVEGRELEGVHFAMEFLTEQNKCNAGEIKNTEINAKNKTVVVIGGGDTGADCIGTAIRQGAKEVIQYEILPKPPVERDATMPWPMYPQTLKVSTSHEEGCTREWCVSTKKLTGTNGKVSKIHGVKVEWEKKDGRFVMKELEGTEFEQKADLVILAMGFLGPQHEGMLKEFGLVLDARGNVQTDKNYMSSRKGVFAAGDMRTGQSLVVRAINDGRQVAQCVDEYLMND